MRLVKGEICFIKSSRRSWKTKNKKKRMLKDEGTHYSIANLMNLKRPKQRGCRLSRESSRSSTGHKRWKKKRRRGHWYSKGRYLLVRRSMVSCHLSMIKIIFGTWLAMNKASKMAIRIKKISFRWVWAKWICLILRNYSSNKMLSFWIRS